MDYIEAQTQALKNTELIENYDRLTGSQLAMCLKGIKQGGINHQIDLSSGRFKKEILKFNQFYYDFIWSMLPNEAFDIEAPIKNN